MKKIVAILLSVIFTLSLSFTAFAADEVIPSAINGYGIKVTGVSSTGTSTSSSPTITITGENLPILSQYTASKYYGKNYTNIIVEAPSLFAWSCSTCGSGIELISTSSTQLVFKIQGNSIVPGSTTYTGDLNIYLSSGTETPDSDDNKSILGKFNLSTGIFTEGDKYAPDAPSNLMGTADGNTVNLTWGPPPNEDVKYYNVYVDGQVVKTVSAPVTSASIEGMNLGSAHNIQVSAVDFSGNESPKSNAYTTNEVVPGRAILTIYLVNGTEKEYDLSMAEVNAFIDWYDAKDAGSGPAKYAFIKTWNKGPFKSRTEYVIFDKILTFNVDEYDPVQ